VKRDFIARTTRDEGKFSAAQPGAQKTARKKMPGGSARNDVFFCRPKRRAALKDGLCKTMKDGGLPAAGRLKVAATKT